jgi:serine/threonine protein phosphatase PrpC
MVRTFTFSAAGGHPANEDAFALVPTAAGVRAALADGQGGRAGGARAAHLACRVALETAAPWEDALACADAAVSADPLAGFTTLVALEIESDCVRGASCGDSAAVAVWGSGLIRLLTAAQHKNPPVGSGEAAFVPFELELAHPWKLLLISDGVWKYASWERVWKSAAKLSGDELLDDLQRAARLPATGEFQDDFTAVLLESE